MDTNARMRYQDSNWTRVDFSYVSLSQLRGVVDNVMGTDDGKCKSQAKPTGMSWSVTDMDLPQNFEMIVVTRPFKYTC